MEGKSETEGRLEICFGRRWGTVSSDGWSETEAQVVCRDLGYEFLSGNSNEKGMTNDNISLILVCLNSYRIYSEKCVVQTYLFE